MTVIEVVELPAALAATRFPPLHMVEQRFRVPPAVDPTREIERQWAEAWSATGVPSGGAVAVAVGSRGIRGLPSIVATVVRCLRQHGCRPFIVPAMGSHGNATAEGQLSVLADLGVTESTVQAPVRSSLDVVSLGEAEGLPLYMDRLAAEADSIVLINRVKPHTDFVGRFESGLMKMLVIGLGNHVGASACHQQALTRGLADVIETVGTALLRTGRVALGIAVVENQHHEACEVRLLPATHWKTVEPRLLERARALLPRLPLDDIDVLLVDEMGKDVSGAGMDPNVTARSVGSWVAKRERPRIARIVVRSLTPAAEGNATGLGSVDVAPRRLIDQVDMAATATNALTSCAPEDCKLPLTVATDRDALVAALATLRPHTVDDLRLVHIRNTLALERLEVSPGCLPHLRTDIDLIVSPDPLPLAFDGEGALISRL